MVMNIAVIVSALVGMMLGMIPPGCLAVGYVIGRKHRRQHRVVAKKETELTAEQMEERKRLIAEQEAFTQQMTYGIEAAYKIGENPFSN